MSMQSWDLLCLPISVLYPILSSGVALKELVRLDTAHCHNHHREMWLRLLASKPFCFHQPVDLSKTEMVRWLLKKSIKASNIQFSGSKEMLEVSEFLHFCGSSVRTVEFTRFGGNAFNMSQAAIYCRYISILRLMTDYPQSSMRDVLWCNQHIQELSCDGEASHLYIFDGLNCQAIKILRMTHVKFQHPDLPWPRHAHSDSLHTVVWDGSEFDRITLQKMLENCPSLRSISLNQVGTENGLFASLAPQMARIVNLSLAGNYALVDSEIFCIAKNVTILRSLNMMHCAALTDRSLQHLADHCGHTLHTLYTDLKEPLSWPTEHVLQTFASKCTQLKILSINCHYILCLGRATSLLVLGCPLLHSLIFNSYDVVSPTSQDLIRAFRPKLKIILRDESNEYDILSMPN